MKLVRCTIHPSQRDNALDALEPFDVLSLTVMGGWTLVRPDGEPPVFYRGCEYKVRLREALLVDVVVPDREADAIVSVLGTMCSSAPGAENSRILVIALDGCYCVGSRPRRIA
jgi:nitrogen regulatory protein PII